jgi:hypothetical protein
MNLCRALLIATLIAPAAAAPALAQFQPPPQQQEPPPCIKQFIKLRDEVETKAKAIAAARKHKVSPQEGCNLFSIFTAAETKMIKYANTNAAWCGIPPQALQQMKTGHAKAMEMRTRICQIAAAPPRPTGPTLSDALAPAIPDADNIKSGHGTYDTLTGTPLGTR